MFPSSYRNTSGRLGEREIEVEVSTQFRVLPNFHECFLFLLKNNPYRKLKRGNSLLYQSKFSMLFMMAYAMEYNGACFPYSYRNTVFRQSKLTFSKCYFFQTPHNPHLPTLREKAILLCRMMPNYEKRFPEDFELHAQYLELINYVYRYHEFSLKLRLHIAMNRVNIWIRCMLNT